MERESYAPSVSRTERDDKVRLPEFLLGDGRSFSSAVPESLLSNATDTSHYNFVSFLAVCQHCGLDFLPLSWTPALPFIGVGGTARISESSINLQHLLVFKRVKWESEPDPGNTSEYVLNYMALVSEVWALTQPALHDHPNVINIEGICWEFLGGTQKVSPVLLFRRAEFGDLRQFMDLHGKKISLLQRLDICLQIAKGLLVVHRSHIIHGDIKPENILIFGQSYDNIIVKVTDFGYSTLTTQGSELIDLPQSEPWCAPEYHGRGQSFVQAKKADVFSFGMLCLWILFNEHIAVIARNEQSCSVYSFLEDSKFEDSLLPFSRELVRQKNNISENQKSLLLAFFDSTLTKNPLKRASDFMSLKNLLQIDMIIYTTFTSPSKFLEVHPYFNLSKSMRGLTLADYRVRVHLVKALELQSDRSQCICCAQNASRQLALIYYIGFGVPSSKDDSTLWQERGQMMWGELQEEVEVLISGKEDVIFHNEPIHRLIQHQFTYTVNIPQLHESFISPAELRSLCKREVDDMQKVLGDSHDVVFNLRCILAVVMMEHGHYKRAIKLRKGLLRDIESNPNYGPKHPVSISIKIGLVEVLFELARLKTANRHIKDALRDSKAIFGIRYPITIRCMQVYATICLARGQWNTASRLHHRITSMTKKSFGEAHPRTLRAYSELARTYAEQENWEQAERISAYILSTAIRTLGEQNLDTVGYHIQHAVCLDGLERVEEASTLQEKALNLAQASLGQDHPLIVELMANIGSSLCERGDFKKAQHIEEEVLRMKIAMLGSDHPSTVNSKGNLALTYSHQYKHEEAETLQLEVMKSNKKYLGLRHPSTLLSMGNLASNLSEQNRLQEAERLELYVMKMFQKTLGYHHPKTLRSMHNLASTFSKQQAKIGDGIALYESALRGEQRILGKRHSQTLITMSNLAQTYLTQGRLDDAENLQVEALNLSSTSNALGPRHPDTLDAMRVLFDIYTRQRKFVLAESLIGDIIQHQSQRNEEEDPQQTMSDIAQHALLSALQNRWELAKSLQTRIMDENKLKPPDVYIGNLVIANQLAANYMDYGLPSLGRKLALEIIQRLETMPGGQDHELSFAALENLEGSYFEQDMYLEALQTQKPLFERSQRVFGPEDPQTLTRGADLALIYSLLGQFADSATLNSGLIALSTDRFGSDSEETLALAANLALNHVHQNQWDEAASLALTYISVDDPEDSHENQEGSSEYRKARIVAELARCSKTPRTWKKAFDKVGWGDLFQVDEEWK